MRLIRTGAICRGSTQRGRPWCITAIDSDADRGADATTIRYQIANPRGHISLRVFLRLTAMDVCCGPPTFVPASLTA